MMAACRLSEKGEEAVLIEKNEKLGKKLYITGKGRCNFTNDCTRDQFFNAVAGNARHGKFLYSAYDRFSAQDAIRFFSERGLAVKTERGARVFPASDHASDVIKTLSNELKKYGTDVRLNCEVRDVLIDDGHAAGVLLASGETIPADQVVVATGGLSYASTGSTGDGYRFASEAGHTVTDRYPSLTGICVSESMSGDPDFLDVTDCQRLQGLSLKNCRICLTKAGKEKKLYEDFGELLFTHYGLSGPVILSLSSRFGPDICHTDENGGLILHIDLKPALSHEQLVDRFLRELRDHPAKAFKNVVDSWFPKSLLQVILDRLSFDVSETMNCVTYYEREEFLHLIKDLKFSLSGLRDYTEAVITKGGVLLKEIDPGTMESKIVKGLYFIGEVLDLDALTGGFNLQIAWCTAAACAEGIIMQENK